MSVIFREKRQEKDSNYNSIFDNWNDEWQKWKETPSNVTEIALYIFICSKATLNRVRGKRHQYYI